MAKKMVYASKATADTRAQSYKKDKELPKMSIAETREALKQAYDYINTFNELGFCVYCATFKKREVFYASTDPRNKAGITPICKECMRKIGLRVDNQGQEHECTKESLQDALFYANKPYLDSIWDSSVQESENEITGKRKSGVYQAYLKNVAMVNYYSLGYRDSDFFKKDSSSTPVFYADEAEKRDEYQISQMDEEDVNEFEKNKADVKKLLGYLPYESESASDQVQLYGQLIGLIDANGDENDDMIRNQSCISICRSFLQASKIDNAIAAMMADVKNIEQNAPSIKSLQDSKKNIMAQITSLAAESQLSLKNARNKSKGSNSWSGKIKAIRDLNLRQVNMFDIKTCKGMQQVQEISDASIMKQLALDESEWSDMVAEMRVTNRQLYDERDAYQEINRIILKENLDLRDTLEEYGLLNDKDLVDLRELYSAFRDRDEEDEKSVSEEKVEGTGGDGNG